MMSCSSARRIRRRTFWTSCVTCVRRDRWTMSERRRPMVVFDWDGTLVDTLPSKIAHAAALLSREFDADSAAVERAYRRHSGVPRRDLFAAIARELGAEPFDDENYARVSQSFSTLNRAGLGPEILFPDTIAVLEALRSARVVVAVS